MWWSDYWPMPWMAFGPLFMMLMVVGCVVMMFFMMRGHRSHHRSSMAVEILKERYARGEIDKTEYEERRHLLDA